MDDPHFIPIVVSGKLRSDFWINLKNNCPRLRRVVLRNIGDSEEDPWVNDSGLLEIQVRS
jgi:hypothetical protein